MFCPYCGLKNRGKSEYCERCGRSFTAVGRESSEICSVCKKDIPADAKYCWYCGERFEEEKNDDKNTVVQDQPDQDVVGNSEATESGIGYNKKYDDMSPEEADFEEVFISFSHNEVAIVKSILDAGRVRYFCKGYHFPSLSHYVEPVRFCVYKWDVEKAVNLLKDIENVLPNGTESDKQ